MSVNILNVFNQDAFGVVALTNAVNDITPTYGKLGALGLFTDEGINQNIVAVDFDPVTNQLIPQSQWGGPGVANKTASGRSRSYKIPHFPINDNILAADLQGRRRPGSDQVQDAQWLMGKKMAEMKVKLEQTQEWMKLGVLKAGLVKDGAGTTILDIYGDFSISQVSTSFVLGTTTTDIMGKIAARKRTIITALRGELMTRFVSLCADDFYDAFVSHPNVKVAFTYFQNNNGQNLGGDYSSGADPNNRDAIRGFQFGEVTWINYTGSVTDSTGASVKMIEDGSAYMFPMGTAVFKQFFAPADYLETVNTEGVPFYVKQKNMDYDKGIDVECQSNPLPICLKPLVIQKLTIS
jgi:hypothetical protein